MSKKVYPLGALIAAINAQGFEVSLRPLGTTVSAPKAKPAVAAPSLASRIDAAAPIVDSAAPYGRKLDGTPKKAPGRKKGSAKPAAAPAAVVAPTVQPAPAAPAAPSMSIDMSAIFGTPAAPTVAAPVAKPAPVAAPAPVVTQANALDDLEDSLAGL